MFIKYGESRCYQICLLTRVHLTIRREAIYVGLEINNKHANVSLLTKVANNMERQQLPTGVVFQSRVLFYPC